MTFQAYAFSYLLGNCTDVRIKFNKTIPKTLSYKNGTSINRSWITIVIQNSPKSVPPFISEMPQNFGKRRNACLISSRGNSFGQNILGLRGIGCDKAPINTSRLVWHLCCINPFTCWRKRIGATLRVLYNSPFYCIFFKCSWIKLKVCLLRM